MPRWANLPNLLTLSRLVFAPFIVFAILHGRHFFALELFAAAAVTDLLDGAAARRWGVATEAGAYLDPIADKCLMSSVYLAMAAAHTVPVWLVALIFGRDLYILAGVGLVLSFTDVRKFPPSVWGKASTFIQIVTAVAWMARNAFAFRIFEVAAGIMVWPCAAATLLSGAHYTWRGIRIARSH